jgi:glycerol-3-phosphate dehydrogenase
MPASRSSDQTIFDLAVIGGGINGAGIARDAAGRGWKVLLCEKGDLGGATSAASTKLVHGGLRYLEHYKFRLVREALQEREVLWGIAPHIIWPLRFVLPHHKGLRPAWLLRLGLFLYDHIGGRKRLPATRSRRLDDGVLKPSFTRGFEYSDCWVEDSRLVVLNARDAADRGAEILPRTECVSATREDGLWTLKLLERGPGGELGQDSERVIRARTLVNAAGPWVAAVLGQVLRANSTAKVRMVQGSHIVVKRLYAHDRCYIFQNTDGRIFFAIPYERDFTLIGTTDQDYQGDPAQVRISESEIAYLCAGASDYFRRPVTPDQVVWTFSGVRPLYDDGASAAQEATRDYVLALDAPEGQAAALSVFGGKITTYRRLALSALERLAPHLPKSAGLPAGWTAEASLPGGDFPRDGAAALAETLRTTRPWLAPDTAVRLVRAYGTKALDILGDATSAAELGPVLGADLSDAELRYLADREWAMTGEDVVWRRSKLGLRLDAAQIAAIDRAVQRHAGTP